MRSARGRSRRVAGYSGPGRKTRRNRRRFNIRVLLLPVVVLALSGAIGTGVHSLLTTPKLRVTTVAVRGAKLVSAADIQKDASIAIGRNIIALHRRDICERIMKRPEVKSVAVGRRLPKMVVVTVAERTPYLTLTNGAGFWLVDRGGLPFHRVSGAEKSVPLVTLPPGALVVPGRKVINSGLGNAMACMECSPSLSRRISKISVDRAGNVCLNMGSDFYVKLGQPVDIGQKMSKLSELIAAEPDIGKRVEYINVSCYEYPALKPKPANAVQKSAEKNT